MDKRKVEFPEVPAEVRAKVLEIADSNPLAGWIIGKGWDKVIKVPLAREGRADVIALVQLMDLDGGEAMVELAKLYARAHGTAETEAALPGTKPAHRFSEHLSDN